MKEKIYKLTLDIKNPNIPFAVERSISEESGDLIQVFAMFQLRLVQFMTQLRKEAVQNQINLNDDIPF